MRRGIRNVQLLAAIAHLIAGVPVPPPLREPFGPKVEPPQPKALTPRDIEKLEAAAARRKRRAHRRQLELVKP